MALTAVEIKDVVRLHLQGLNLNQIANKLDICHQTAAKYVNDPEIVPALVDHKKRYITKLLKGREAKLDCLLETTEDAKGEFTALDQAYERFIKIDSGYYISHDKLKMQVIPAILASITHHVKKQATLDAIAADLANISLD